jgi:hypothetical protein
MPQKQKEAYESLVNFIPKSDEYRLAGLMRLAEIYEAEGKREKGLVIYGDIAGNSKNPEWVSLAKDRMEVLKSGTEKPAPKESAPKKSGTQKSTPKKSGTKKSGTTK